MFHSAVRFLDYVFGPSVTRVHKSTDGLNRVSLTFIFNEI